MCVTVLLPRATLSQYAIGVGPIRFPDVSAEAQNKAENDDSGNTVRNLVRGGEGAPIVISNSTVPSLQTHTHIASWDAVEHVARGDGGPALARSTSLASQHSPNMRSEVWMWTDYIRRFGVQSDRGAQTYSEGTTHALTTTTWTPIMAS
ncbi:UNVERIFIED_CONTAM: hypothetical protein Sindi_0819900 [Sesamum indicum]